MFWGKEINKVAESVTHTPYQIEIAGQMIEVPRPSVRTQVAVMGKLALLSDTPEEPSYLDLARHLAQAGILADIAAIYLTGSEDRSLAKSLTEHWSIQDLMAFVVEVMSKDRDVEGFFAFTTSLRERNILKPTREVETPFGD